MIPALTVDELGEHVARRAAGTDRYLLGLAGPPGSGKSTIAAELARRLDAIVVPMDGYHRGNEELEALGLRDVKGSPPMFAADEFVEMVGALRAHDGDVALPSFDRDADAPIPEAIVVSRDDRIVIVEGNYLLLDHTPWNRLGAYFDLVAHIDLDDGVRRDRLIARHVRYGMTPEEAARFALDSDEPNARLVARGRDRADIVVAAV